MVNCACNNFPAGLGNVTFEASVGIGTSTPGANTRLNVVGGAVEISSSAHTADASLHISSAFGGLDRLTQISPTGASKPGLNLMASNNASGGNQWWGWGVRTDNKWRIQVGAGFDDSAAGIVIDSTGKVGIGMTTPGQKLEVNGNIKMSGGRTKLFYRGDIDSHIGSLAIYSPDGGITAIITPYDSAGGNIANSAIRLGGFGSFDSNTVNLAVSGKVGIGTSNPGPWDGGSRKALHIADITNQALLRIQGSAVQTEYGVSVGGTAAFLNTRTNHPLILGANNQEHVRITGPGNVGIGTPDPAEKLDVNGNIKLVGSLFAGTRQVANANGCLYA